MNQPPIPPVPESQGRNCPNCGQAVSSEAQRCPHCGATLVVSSGPSVWKVLGACALAVLALGFGALGACFMLIGGVSLASGDTSAALIAVPIVGVAALCLWGAIRLLKR